MTHPEDTVPTFNWDFENQPVPSGILMRPSRYKRAKSNLLADVKGPQQRDPGKVVVWLYIYIYRFNVVCYIRLTLQ